MDDLRAHLLPRLRPELANQEAFTEAQRRSVIFDSQCLFRHATARFNFTTYDLQRDQDLINPRTAKNGILVYTTAPDSSGHPWLYARVLGIFHALAVVPGMDKPKRLEFLWVRWMERDEDWTSGAQALRLERVCYVDETSAHAFGFVDPAHVIRGCHFIPAFHKGLVEDILESSLARDQIDGDWKYHYVNR